MQLPTLLEVAISLALLYLFFSQIVSSIHELFAGYLGVRGKYLRQWLNQALNDRNTKNWAELLYLHPLIDTLAKKEGRPPAYIPPELFAKGIIDLVIDEARVHRFVQHTETGTISYELLPPNRPTPADGQPALPAADTLEQFKLGLGQIAEGDLKALLRTLLLDAEGSVPNATDPLAHGAVFTRLHDNLGKWYDSYMERVTGWYKQKTRIWLFLIGLLVAVSANLDSLRVGHYLWTHAATRQQFVQQATVFVQAHPHGVGDSLSIRLRLPPHTSPADSLQAYRNAYRAYADSLVAVLSAQGLPIGWSSSDKQRALSDTLYIAVASTPERGPAGSGWQRAGYWLQYRYLSETQPRKGSIVPRKWHGWRADTIAQLRPTQHLVPLSEKELEASRLSAVRQLAQTRVLLRQAQPSASGSDFPETAASSWLGWLLTAAALSLGAPFWFDLLKRFVNARNVGLKPTTVEEKKTS